MSMRVSGGEESCIESSSTIEVRTSEDASPSHTAISTVQRCESSPLLRIFSSKEIVPKILEYERALLVMKEHDYAKAPERPEIVKLSSLLSESPLLCEDSRPVIQPSDSMTDLNTLLATRKELVLFRESLAKKEDNVLPNHCREVIGMQIELIREQQEQLQDKDKELNTARKDKEQLQARLERMERRLAILQKNSRSKYDIAESDSPQHLSANSSLEISMDTSVGTTPQIHTPRIRTHRDSAINSDRHSRSRSGSKDTVVARTGRSSRISSHAGTPTPQEVQDSPMNVSLKRNAKRKLSENATLETPSSKKKKSKQMEMRTQLEYSKLDLPIPYQFDEFSVGTPTLFEKSLNHLNLHGRRNSSDTTTSAASSTVSGSSISGGKGIMNGNDHESTILVPSWRTHAMQPSTDVDPMECEELSEDAFLRRHRKPEEDEKRRKRWDLQRTRTLRTHEELLRKYNQKGGGGEKPEKKKEKIHTFQPKLSEVEAIEIKDTVTVTAFGMPVPLLKSRDFELPWFDLEAREAKESLRTTRSKTRNSSRQSIGSSADEDPK